jgi:hypothetical protein
VWDCESVYLVEVLRHDSMRKSSQHTKRRWLDFRKWWTGRRDRLTSNGEENCQWHVLATYQRVFAPNV